MAPDSLAFRARFLLRCGRRPTEVPPAAQRRTRDRPQESCEVRASHDRCQTATGEHCLQWKRDKMVKHIWRKCIVLTLMLTVVGSIVPYPAAADEEPASLLIPLDDLPPGSSIIAESDVSVSVNGRFAQLACRDQSADSQTQLKGVVADRRISSSSSGIVENLIGRAISEDAASSLQRDVKNCLRLKPTFPVVGLSNADGWVVGEELEGVLVDTHVISFRRGMFVFIVATIEARPASPDLAVHLAVEQAARAPDGSSTPAPEGLDTPSIFGFAMGTLFPLFLIFPEIADGVRSRGDRLNRHLRRLPAAPDVRPDQIVDITYDAAGIHVRAIGWFLLELIVVIAALPVMLGTLRYGSYVDSVVALGFIVTVLAIIGWLRKRKFEQGRIVRGRRSVLSVAVSGVAAFIGVAGLLLVMSSAIPIDVGRSEYMDGSASLSNSANLYLGLVPLAVSVALQRLATRLTMSRPARSVLRDRRPPILYLRSFVDDHLKTRVAPFARASFLERFSTRRKQGFEEILAGELQRYGPVVAISEPGRRFSPIGFVRQSLPHVEWQAGVRRWMVECRAVVIVLGRSEGLTWELKTLIELGELQKVVVLLPPVSTELRQRWVELGQLLEANGISRIGFPSKLSVLALTFTDAKEARYFCGKNLSGWSYRAATEAALDRITATSER